jgi:hypothetical protein
VQFALHGREPPAADHEVPAAQAPWSFTHSFISVGDAGKIEQFPTPVGQKAFRSDHGSQELKKTGPQSRPAPKGVQAAALTG